MEIQRKRSAALLLAVFAASAILSQVQADYLLEVRAFTYRNGGHRDSNGDCCDYGFFSCNGCDNQFVFCLRSSSTSNDGNPSNCPLGRYSTGDIGGDSITFSTPNLASGVPNPMTFSGSVWPGTVRLFIEVEDYDSFNSDDHVDDIYVTLTRSPSSSFSSRTTYTGIHGNGRIELNYRVTCTSNYYGSDCATFCRGRDDSLGHYRCGSSGQKICLSGWSDPSNNCLTPVCSSGCHPAGGFCTTPGQCLCRNGWTGSNCGTCIPSQGCSTTGGYCSVPDECICHSGYSGSSCEVDLLPCERRSPCQNGAHCTNDGSGGYTCLCVPGYQGTNCESEIDECISNPCQNQGTCTDRLNGYTCECATGYTGDSCQVNVDDCQSNRCVNGATCIDGVNDYTCQCAAGFVGRYCETDHDDCSSSPCFNGGSCMDRVNDFECRCAPGYYGDQCETERDECASNPCLNAVRCHDRVNGYFCECRSGYSGTNCEVDIDECASNPCVQGTCQDLFDDYECTCTKEFEGKHCEIDMNVCRSKPCLNGGMCTNSPNSFVCSCAPGFTGSLCNSSVTVEQPSALRNSVAGGVVGGVVIVLILVVMVVVAVVIFAKKSRKREDHTVTRYDNEVNAADNPTYGVGLGTLVGRTQGVYSTCGPEEPCPLYEDLDKLGTPKYMYANVQPVVHVTSPFVADDDDLDKKPVEGKEDLGAKMDFGEYDIVRTASEANP